VIRDLKIIRGSNGHFVEMPTKWQGGRRFEIASTITTKARKMLEDKVFAEYKKTHWRIRDQTQAILTVKRGVSSYRVGPVLTPYRELLEMFQDADTGISIRATKRASIQFLAA
jgi:SpoVG